MKPFLSPFANRSPISLPGMVETDMYHKTTKELIEHSILICPCVSSSLDSKCLESRDMVSLSLMLTVPSPVSYQLPPGQHVGTEEKMALLPSLKIPAFQANHYSVTEQFFIIFSALS